MSFYRRQFGAGGKTIVLIALALLASTAFWLLTEPSQMNQVDAAVLAPADPARGEMIFWAGGCRSCHAPTSAKGETELLLGGGDPLETPFGTFNAPNISPHPTNGIGSWTLLDFANALRRGVSPDSASYYPAFPYSSYTRMSMQDIADLFAFLKTLPPVAGEAEPHDLSFPFNIRRGVGLWARLFLDDAPVVEVSADASDLVLRGQYLVEGPGHCGQCHTPRSLWGAGGLISEEWLAGAPSPEGRGRIPNITSSQEGIGSWSTSDIAYFLETGFTPDFDSVGGSMVEVQQNIAKLPAEDREAIAAYLKAVPPQPVTETTSSD